MKHYLDMDGTLFLNQSAFEIDFVQAPELLGKHTLQKNLAEFSFAFHRHLLRAEVGKPELLQKPQRRNLADRGFVEGGVQDESGDTSRFLSGTFINH